MEITVTVNGTAHTSDVEPRLLLVHYLREALGLTGTNIGCDTSSCGACTVHVNGESVKSCTMLAVQAEYGGSVVALLDVGRDNIDKYGAVAVEPSEHAMDGDEVVTITGRPFSENDSWDDYDSSYVMKVAGLTRERAELRARIAKRADEMLDERLVAEVERLGPDGFGRTASQALGYRQVLEMPGVDRSELAEAISRATARFARRQESWFKTDPRVTWFDASAPDLGARLIDYLRPESS